MQAGSTENFKLGLTAALAAFITWGAAPIFFKALTEAPPLEIIAHRILWSIPVLAGFLLLRDGRKFYARLRLSPRQVLGLIFSGFVLAINWWLFVWAIDNDQVLATSLGYFINPLVNIFLGFLFLKERLRPLEVAAVVVAALGTAYLTWFLGVAPWISLGIAFSFGVYALIRKQLDVGPMVGLLWESLLLSIPAIIFLASRLRQGELAFGFVSTKLDILLVMSGLITVLPLIWFHVAARNMTMTTLGLIQYIAPTMSFLLAVFVYDELFTQGHAVAFICIWAGLLVISVDRLWRARWQTKTVQ